MRGSCDERVFVPLHVARCWPWRHAVAGRVRPRPGHGILCDLDQALTPDADTKDVEVSPAVSRAKVLADFYFDADTHARAVSGSDSDSDAESEMLPEMLQMQMMLEEGEKAEVEMQCKILEDIHMQRTLDESLRDGTLDESLLDETLDESLRESG